MKIFKFSVLLSFGLLPLSSYGVTQIPCADPGVFCLEELQSQTSTGTPFEKVIQSLPTHVRQNLTFKRGSNILKTINGIKDLNLGPHGHLAPGIDSQSASPMEPRAFVWDETSGFVATWNSGDPAQKAGDRLDLYDFDFNKMEHRLGAWTSADGFKDHTLTDASGKNCTSCHGNIQRPIFPMYPDWPQFYGEFNDEMAGYPGNAQALRSDLKELSNKYQPIDRNDFLKFLAGQAKTNPRYTPLFSVKPSEGLNANNPYYPFRPRNTTSPFSDVSRAFYHRPNLRLGVMLHRLTALQVFEKIKHSKVFKKYPDIIFYSLLDCNWGIGQADRKQILDTLLAGATSLDPHFGNINLRGIKYNKDELASVKGFIPGQENGATVYFKQKDYTDPGYMQIPYEDLLALLELKIADVDIRFPHNTEKVTKNKFNVFDPKAFHFTNSVMDLGYIDDTYALNPICDNKSTKCNFSYKGKYMEGMRYFNSYFDGSATTNELLAAQMLLYLVNTDHALPSEELESVRNELRKTIKDPDVYLETLANKYANFTERLKYDSAFFKKMDSLSPWLQLPYSPDLINTHNREIFWENSIKATLIRNRHAQWLTLDDRKKNVKNKNSICWSVYDSMKARYLQKK